MDPAEWLAVFRAVHEQAKTGRLSPQERARYLLMREEFARGLATAHAIEIPQGELARKHFRVAQAFRVEIENLYQALTKEISLAGFTALLSAKLEPRKDVSYSLVLGRSHAPLQGRARVLSAEHHSGTFRVHFAFNSLAPDDAERLELALLDAALQRL